MLTYNKESEMNKRSRLPKWAFFMLAVGFMLFFLSGLFLSVGAQQDVLIASQIEVLSRQRIGNQAYLTETIEWPVLALQEVISGGIDSPVGVTHAGDGSGRLFIIEKGGTIRIYQAGTLLTEPFLDISQSVSRRSEQGLLGLVFSPNYVTNGTFYVNYTDLEGTTQIVRYRVSANPDLADAESAQVVLSVEQDFVNHNGGQIAFAADNKLYIGMGDGGSANDPRNRAQDPQSLLGKMLRIDVESNDPLTYTIPLDNPFVNDSETLDEIWALGLRNPWRFSFDTLTNELYIADVGQWNWEEINVQAATSSGGENYGWRCYEGTQVNNDIVADCEVANPTPPIFEYAHTQDPPDYHCSITGGMVYRGSSYARMNGVYFYADYCSGYIWGLRKMASGWENHYFLRVKGDISTFGQDEAGNLYLATLDGNQIYQLIDLEHTIYFPMIR